MNEKIAAERIEYLTQKINHYNKTYFQKAHSAISDYAFDQLLAELHQLEEQFPNLKQPHSPTQHVGENLSNNFPIIQHKYPMHSLNNSYSLEEVKQFIERISKHLDQSPQFFCELKFDGIAISLNYQNHKLHKIVTRGDGTQGDDITSHLSTIKNLPLSIQKNILPNYFEVRGEAFMTRTAFQTLNQTHKKEGKKPLANPRNTVAGTLKTLDIKAVSTRQINFYPYTLLAENLTITTQQQRMHTLAKAGFQLPLNTSKHCQNIHEIINYIHYWEKHKQELDIEIDGIVIKVNNINQQKILGHTAKSPRWAIAYKYKPKNTTTLLQKVTYQVGRTGIITPVAHLTPIHLAGTTVQRASLYNITHIKHLGLCRGDTVYIEKKGEIIPKIVGINLSKRLSNTRIMFDGKCPSCGTTCLENPTKTLHYCPNHHQCPQQLKNLLLHFVSRPALNIKYLGIKTVNALFTKRLISTPATLYHIQPQDLAPLEGFQTKSIQKLLESIEKSKTTPFHKVLFALGIHHVGATIAKKLAIHFHNLDNLINATQDELITLPEIGIEIAESIISYFQNQHNLTHISQLRKLGLHLSVQHTPTNTPQKLTQKTFVISGTFATHSRETIQAYIQDRGGRIVSAISQQVDYLLVGKNPGPKKIQEAIGREIQIIDEEKFFTIAN